LGALTPIIRSSTTQLVIDVLLFVVGPVNTTAYYHDTKVKPEAATVVFELLMMGVRTPESC
jgi:hypothetical protein